MTEGRMHRRFAECRPASRAKEAAIVAEAGQRQCTLYKKLDPARVTTADIALSVAQPMELHLCFARSSSLSTMNLNAE